MNNSRIESMENKLAVLLMAKEHLEAEQKELAAKIGEAILKADFNGISQLNGQLASNATQIKNIENSIINRNLCIDRAREELRFRKQLRKDYLDRDVPDEFGERIFDYIFSNDTSNNTEVIENRYSEIALIVEDAFRAGTLVKKIR